MQCGGGTRVSFKRGEKQRMPSQFRLRDEGLSMFEGTTPHLTHCGRAEDDSLEMVSILAIPSGLVPSLLHSPALYEQWPRSTDMGLHTAGMICT